MVMSAAPFGQIGLASLMVPELASPEDKQVRLYVENVAEVLLNGISLPDLRRGDRPKTPGQTTPTELAAALATKPNAET